MMIGYEIQQAIDNILVSSSGLLETLGDGVNSIIDNPSQQDGIVFPFIRYDNLTQEPNFDKTTNGARINFQISVFTRDGNKQDCLNIVKMVYDLLHDAELTINGYNIISCLWSGISDVMVDDSVEFLLFHGIIQFEILTEEI